MHKRDARYEFIRVVSMILVIGIHSLAQVPRSSPVEVWSGYALTTLFLLCNGLFFMLSGKFSLNARCETISDYLSWYGKRLCSIGIPALLFMLLRTMHNSGWWPAYLRSPELWQDYRINILSGFRASDYWFLYPLTGLLIAAPFLSKLLQKISEKELLLLLGLGMVFNALNIYLPALGFPFSWEYPLDGWFVLFLLGYALERLVKTPKTEVMIMLFGCGCFALTVIQQHLGFDPGAHDLAPAYAVMCAAAFLALKRLYRPGKIEDRLFLAVGKHSLSVYLCHAMILSWLSTRIPAESFLSALFMRILLTAILSLGIAFAVDQLVLFPLQRFLSRLPLLWEQLLALCCRLRKP